MSDRSFPTVAKRARLMTLSVTDWIICALVVFSVITAAMQGFFSEALTTAGLIVGYIVAAWKYRSLADWLETFFEELVVS